jgi:hypothetical protein
MNDAYYHTQSGRRKNEQQTLFNLEHRITIEAGRPLAYIEDSLPRMFC